MRQLRVMLRSAVLCSSALLFLPLHRLWDMKTGGILSRLTGDVDTTTGLMQMALVLLSISVVRLLIAVVVLGELELAGGHGPGHHPRAMLISFTAARRIAD